jgi:hypothetical protein
MVKPFTYTFQGQSHNAFSDHYLVEGYERYHITFGDQHCDIVPAEVPGPGGSIVWLQQNEPDEKMQPNELIQALGEGLHDAEKI